MTAAQLAAARAAEHLTQAAVAQALGVDLRTYRRWESGELPIGKIAFTPAAVVMAHRLQAAAPDHLEET